MLEDVAIKVGDFYVPINLVILDIANDTYAQIIFGRPFSATVVAKLMSRKGS